jgi:hypothetical protein
MAKLEQKCFLKLVTWAVISLNEHAQSYWCVKCYLLYIIVQLWIVRKHALLPKTQDLTLQKFIEPYNKHIKFESYSLTQHV